MCIHTSVYVYIYIYIDIVLDLHLFLLCEYEHSYTRVYRTTSDSEKRGRARFRKLFPDSGNWFTGLRKVPDRGWSILFVYIFSGDDNLTTFMSRVLSEDFVIPDSRIRSLRVSVFRVASRIGKKALQDSDRPLSVVIAKPSSYNQRGWHSAMQKSWV